MSEYIPKDGSLDVSKTVHEFMSTIEYHPKKDDGRQFKLLKEKTEIFKLGFAIGYTNDLAFLENVSDERMTISPRGFPMENYRQLLEKEAIRREISIGGLVSKYADAGLIFLRQNMTSNNLGEFISKMGGK